jgi:hypothetical protein
MTIATAIAEAIAELDLYEETAEAEAGRVLLRPFLDLDEIILPGE